MSFSDSFAFWGKACLQETQAKILSNAVFCSVWTPRSVRHDTCQTRPTKPLKNFFYWRQIWRVAGRESDYPELLGSPRTSGEVPQTSPEVFRRLPRKFSHCGTLQQSRGSPEVCQTSPEVPRTSPEVSRTSPEVSPFSGKPDTLS